MRLIITARIQLINNEMKVHHLPHYTAERFYLLSELEQKVQFIFLDELLGDGDNDSDADGAVS